MARCKQSVITDAVLDQLLAGANAKTAFEYYVARQVMLGRKATRRFTSVAFG